MSPCSPAVRSIPTPALPPTSSSTAPSSRTPGRRAGLPLRRPGRRARRRARVCGFCARPRRGGSLCSRAVEELPGVVVEDVQTAFGAGRARRGRPGDRPHGRRGHRVVRQDVDQGPSRPGARQRRADRRTGELAQRRDRRAAHGVPRDARDPFPRRRDGGAGDRPPRLPDDDRAAGRRDRPQRRRRARRGVRLAGGGRPGQGRAGGGAAPQDGSRSSTPTTPTSRRCAPARRRGW